MKLSIIFSFLLVIFCCKFAVADDSIPTQQMNEVVVVGDDQWIENGIMNFIPTKIEKKLSNSPASLIKSMHLPFVKERDGMIVSLAGEVIPIFINGEKADDIDLAVFWPKEVKRVQYIEHPSDPNFEGANVAINFIMPKYSVGGVSRINIYQKMPNNGYYTASSKIVYKKMTYGFLLSGNYYRDHRSKMNGETTYNNLFYDNTKYEFISRDEENHSLIREDGLRCAFNAKYATERYSITHKLSFSWERNPGSDTNSTDLWNPNLFESSNGISSSNSKSLSPQIMGNYYFKLTEKCHFSSLWKYSYARNSSNTFNQLGLTAPVLNSNDEDVNTFKATILPSYILSDKWIFQFKFDYTIDLFSTIYRGTTNTTQDQARQSVLSAFKFNWNPDDHLSVSIDPGFAASFWKVGGIKEHSIYPTITSSINWNPTRKFSINGALYFYMRPTSASESNPVLVKNSELLWALGNPYLKNLTSWDTYIHSTYLPEKWLTLSFGFGYVKTFNNTVTTYSPASKELGGLIKETINAKPCDNIRANLELAGSFFNDTFTIGISPQWYHTYVRGLYHSKFNYLTLSGSADYTIGNFRIELLYEGPYKDLTVSGMEKSWKHDNWNFAVIYGNDNLYLDLKIVDIFNNYRKSWIQYNSPNLNSYYNYLETGRAISLNLTYTFGYGKKVDKRIDITGPESVKTSIYR